MDKKSVVPSTVPYPTRLRDGSDAVQSAGDNVAEEFRGENREAITESASLKAVTALGTVV